MTIPFGSGFICYIQTFWNGFSPQHIKKFNTNQWGEKLIENMTDEEVEIHVIYTTILDRNNLQILRLFHLPLSLCYNAIIPRELTLTFCIQKLLS